MKKILFAAAAMLLAAVSTQAHSDNMGISKNDDLSKERNEAMKEKKVGKDVSYQSKEQFYRDFDYNPDVVWTKTNNYDEVVFTKDGVTATAYYDYNSKLVGVTSLKSFSDLPAAGQLQLQKNYKGYTVKSVLVYDDNENNDADMFLYGNRFEDEDNYFVELQKDNKTIVVQVTMEGFTEYFTSL